MFRFDHAGTVLPRLIITSCILLALARSASSFAQADPAAEPAVLALAKVLPAVVNISVTGKSDAEQTSGQSPEEFGGAPFDDFLRRFFDQHGGRGQHACRAGL